MWLAAAETPVKEKDEVQEFAMDPTKDITPEQEEKVLTLLDQTLGRFINRTKMLLGTASEISRQSDQLDDLIDLEDSIFRELSTNHSDYKDALLDILKAKHMPDFPRQEAATPKERWGSIFDLVDDLTDDELQRAYEKFAGPTEIEVDADHLKYFLSKSVGDLFRVERMLNALVQSRKIEELWEKIREPKEIAEPSYQTVERITSPLTIVKKHYQQGGPGFQDRIYEKITGEVIPMLQKLLDDQVVFLKSIFDKRKNAIVFPKKL